MNTQRPVTPPSVTSLLGIFFGVAGGALILLASLVVLTPATDAGSGFFGWMCLAGGSAMALFGGVLGAITKDKRAWLFAGLPLLLATGLVIASFSPPPDRDASDYQEFVGRPYEALHAEIGNGFAEGWYDIERAEEGPGSQGRIIVYENMTVYVAPDATVVRIVAGEHL